MMYVCLYVILLRVHALLRDPLRGGREHFTARKFDQIRTRLDTFGDFLAKILRLKGFSSFVFLSYFQNLLEFAIFVRVWITYAYFYKYFSNFLKVQNT